MDKNLEKKKTINVAPRLHSYGGVLDALLHSFILATYFKSKINIILVKLYKKKILDNNIENSTFFNLFKFDETIIEKNIFIKLKKKIKYLLKYYLKIHFYY